MFILSSYSGKHLLGSLLCYGKQLISQVIVWDDNSTFDIPRLKVNSSICTFFYHLPASEVLVNKSIFEKRFRIAIELLYDIIQTPLPR